MHSVYVLNSKKYKKYLYIGFSSNLKQRLQQHNKGRVSATKDKRPLELIYCELYKNKKDAVQREKYFKTGWGRNYLRKILKNALQGK